MKKVCLIPFFLVMMCSVTGQDVSRKLAAAVDLLENDLQMSSAIVSIYVMDESTGRLVYEHNSRYALAPASTQKLFTAAAAFEILGRSYRYKTSLNIYEDIVSAGSRKSGMIGVEGSGDPSLGSWRYASTKKEKLLADWAESINAIAPGYQWRSIYVKDFVSSSNLAIPEGYIWQDIGNYYGAGTSYFNWNENQYDLTLKSGGPGAAVTISKVNPMQKQVLFRNELKAGAPGTGDNAWIFAAPGSKEAILKGTIPPSQTAFSISGSMPDPGYTFALDLKDAVTGNKQDDSELFISSRDGKIKDSIFSKTRLLTTVTHQSPSLDSLVYWFLRKSVNLYGEAFLKKIGEEKSGQFATEIGVDALNEFWSSKGIDPAAMQIQDGSGLSPQNRVTTKALVQVLKYSRGREWFPAYYAALPEYNGMKMKSGSIGGCRAYAGYHNSKAGKKYVFAIIINNYTGSAGEVVRKMYKILDNLK
ncbi:MAG: D-alanyl-D-alanine carboxypeptidase/D-alanyl-D-alanine-endopeptidase [Chitinophagaceae bacterium]|nr:MAG: D-alanyl-D-alanine carboxypeptidase/D-alanyl-D-alanine-endopeptidase [Chitinophagaceae bacterium]